MLNILCTDQGRLMGGISPGFLRETEMEIAISVRIIRPMRIECLVIGVISEIILIFPILDIKAVCACCLIFLYFYRCSPGLVGFQRNTGILAFSLSVCNVRYFVVPSVCQPLLI